MAWAVLQPDTITYSSVICACEKAAEWQKAPALLASMARAVLQPNTITYSSAISACEKGAEWQKVPDLLVGMIRLQCDGPFWKQQMDTHETHYWLGKTQTG